MIKLQDFDSSYFCGNSQFKDDNNQNYLVFQPILKYFNKINSSDHISVWKCKGLSDEVIDLLLDYIIEQQ